MKKSHKKCIITVLHWKIIFLSTSQPYCCIMRHIKYETVGKWRMFREWIHYHVRKFWFTTLYCFFSQSAWVIAASQFFVFYISAYINIYIQNHSLNLIFAFCYLESDAPASVAFKMSGNEVRPAYVFLPACPSLSLPLPLSSKYIFYQLSFKHITL